MSISITGQTIDQIGYYYENGTTGLDSKNNFMILSNGAIVDNAIPSTPVLIGQYSFWGDGFTVLVDGDYSYFGTGMTNDLFIADISDINFPLHQGSIDFTIGNGIFGMDIKQNTLFATLGKDGIFCSIDITDKSNPIILDTLFISGGQCRDVVVLNNYAFAAHNSGLKVIDITNVSDLQLITSIGSGYNTIDISDSLVFLGKNGGVDVFNVSDPINPSPAFSIPNSGGTAWDLKYSENHIYVATNSDGLFIYKIESNSGIEMANFPNTDNGQSFGVCLQDSLVLLSGLQNGVAILQYDSLGTVGLKPLSEIKQIKVFPNPAKDFIIIENDNLLIDKVEFIDLKGKVIKLIDNNCANRKINISDLPAGQYLIRIETIDNVVTEKLIKLD